MLPPLFIFDLDSTLADLDHRRPILETTSSTKWDDFYRACADDPPIMQVIATYKLLLQAGAELWIWTGRSEIVRHTTLDWLRKHIGDHEFNLIMRDHGDFTPDDILKKQWLDNMLVDDRRRLVAAFDDRTRVVNMWRNAGVQCFQVAPGDF